MYKLSSLYTIVINCVLTVKKKKKKTHILMSDVITFLFRHQSIMWFYLHWFRTGAYTHKAKATKKNQKKKHTCNYRVGQDGTIFLSPLDTKRFCAHF